MTIADAVSAVIPVYNGELFVAEAIRSALAQTRPPIECLVIDDGSVDRTAEVAAGFAGAVTYVRQERRGVSVARNRGVELASGGLVAFLDHDDIWLPAKLERQVEALTAGSAVMALCAVNVVDRTGAFMRTRRVDAREDLLTGMLMFDGTELVSCSSTGLVRREPFLAMGGFDPALGMSADWDLLLRVLLDGPVVYVDEPLVHYRVHDSNMSRNIAAMEHDMTYAFGKAFADPRLPAPLGRRQRHAYGRLYRMLAGSYRDAGQRTAALRVLTLAVRHDPTIASEIVARVLHREPPSLSRDSRVGGAP